MTPESITIGGRKGTVVYLDADWHPVPAAKATLARVLFADGGSAFFTAGAGAQHLAEREYVRDDAGRFAETEGAHTGPDSGGSSTVNTRQGARAALMDAVGADIPVGVDDHPVAIRAAHETAAVLREMKAKGYPMPPEVEVRVQSGRVSGEAAEGNTLVVKVPDNLPPDVTLDQAFAATFDGKIAVVEDGALRGEIRKFVGSEFRDLILHEMGHINRRGMPPTPYITSRSSPAEKAQAEASAKAFGEEMTAIGQFEHVARASVSDYAAKNPDEFVAEVFTMRYKGEPVSAETRRIYDALRGAPIR